MSFINSSFQQANYSKFYPPKKHSRFFARTRLLELMETNKGNKYTLLQAPEGYGKSSLLAEWYCKVKLEQDNKILWFRVDAYDCTPECFWCNMIEALDQSWPGIKAATLNNMDLLEQSTIPQLILTLANHIVSSSDEDTHYLLFFDDFECFKLTESEGQFFLFANMLPVNVSFVIASREHLSNQLIGQNAYSQFNLLGVRELAVARGELKDILTSYGLDELSESILDTICLKTEGWLFAIYALLEQISKGTPLEKATEELFGTNHFFGDIVFSKAMQDLPQKAMTFLLESSFFEYFSEQFCNYVFDNQEAHAIIQELERRGLFIFAKSSSRVWYRYHYLFAEWLRHQALSMHRNQIRSINFRAASWYHANGRKLLAAKHTAAASEGNFVSDLSKYVFTHFHINDSDLLSFLLSTREDALINDPFFCLFASWAYVFSGRPNEAKEWLQYTNELVVSGRATVSGTVVAKHESREGEHEKEHVYSRGLQGRIDLVSRIIESKCLTFLGEVQTSMKKAKALLQEHGPFLDDRLKMVLYQDLGEAHELSGDIDSAMTYYQKAMTIAQVNGYDFLVGFTRYQIISLLVAQGKLSEAEALCRTAIASCPPDFTVYGALYSVLARIKILQRKHDELDTILRRALGRVSFNRNIDIFLDVCRARVNYLMVNGQFSEALLQASAARKAIIENKDNPPRGTAPLTYALQARLYLKLKDIQSAKDVIAEFESLGYSNTAEGILQQGILVALIAMQEEVVSEDTIHELAAYLPWAEQGKYLLYQIEISLSLAQLYHFLNMQNEAIKRLKKAIDLARREQITFFFLNGGETVRLLLTELVGTRGLGYDSDKFARKLIATFDELEPAKNREKPKFDWISHSAHTHTPSFVGHWGLTRREDEVLQLLVSGMNRKEIAAELCTSQNTIKTHISHIYEKIGVHSVSELLRKMVESEVL